MNSLSGTTSYDVVAADLLRDADRILHVWASNFGKANPMRFRWMYRENIAGKGICFLLTTSNDVTCGVAGLGIRRMKIGDVMTNCAQGIDFAVDKRHRLGRAALLLQRAAIEAVVQNGFAFAYTVPVEQSAKVCSRAGYETFGTLRRWTKPLRAEYALRRHLGATSARFVSRLVDFFTWLRSGDALTGPEGEICSDFDARFDELWQIAAQQFQLVGERNAAFLNWRFRAAPNEGYRTFCLAERGRLLGYLVFQRREDQVSVADFLFRTPQSIRPLLRAFSRAMRRQGVATITISYIGPEAVAHALRDAGFYQRPEVTPLLIYRPPAIQKSALRLTEESCYFTQADKD